MLVELVLGAVLLFILWQILKKPSDLPPGRWGLPLIGSIPLSFKPLKEQLCDLQKKHGDIYVWRMGTQTVVFIHDPKLAKEAFSNTEFMDRPFWQLFSLNEKFPMGVIGSNGLLWHNNRRFALRQLRDLGMGKSKLVSAVHTQALILVEALKMQTDKPAKLPHALYVATVNIIWQMIGGRQFEIDDPKFKKFQDIVEQVMSSMKRLALYDLFPWIDKVLPWSVVSWICNLDLMEDVKKLFFDYFQDVVEQHKATLDRDNPRDLIDAYLIEMEKDKPNSTCSEKDLYFLIFDLFNAGTQTTSDTLTWILLYLANNPRVQEKLQKEIDETLSRDRLVTLEDKTRMPYTEAVLHEVLRISSLAALGGAQHLATSTTQLGGYTIPKGAILCGVFFEMHRNNTYWDRPDDFLPERWLNQEGKFTAKKEGFMPFSAGKRQCVGEALARMELFIFTTILLQHFSFAPPPGRKLDVTPVENIPTLHSPKEQELVVTLRT